LQHSFNNHNAVKCAETEGKKMSSEGANQPAPIPGSMIFYDNYKTPVASGAYRFVLQQTVSLDGGDTHHYYRDQRFEVVAPRYVIEGSEIQAHFPPPGGVADYQSILPHVVLRTRNLPWERPLGMRQTEACPGKNDSLPPARGRTGSAGFSMI
jgi:hypothetical protein